MTYECVEVLAPKELSGSVETVCDGSWLSELFNRNLLSEEILGEDTSEVTRTST
jgi:hypothetical protein